MRLPPMVSHVQFFLGFLRSDDAHKLAVHAISKSVFGYLCFVDEEYGVCQRLDFIADALCQSAKLVGQ